MRLRHATLAIATLTLLGVAACGDSDDQAPAAPAPNVSAVPSAGGEPGGPGGPGASAGPASSADPGTPPTEGTSTANPPKKDGGAAQGPAGKTATTP